MREPYRFHTTIIIQLPTGFLGNSFSETLWKILRKSPMLESFFKKIAGLKPPNYLKKRESSTVPFL